MPAAEPANTKRGGGRAITNVQTILVSAIQHGQRQHGRHRRRPHCSVGTGVLRWRPHCAVGTGVWRRPYNTYGGQRQSPTAPEGIVTCIDACNRRAIQTPELIRRTSYPLIPLLCAQSHGKT
jgi:hypothetical protein